VIAVIITIMVLELHAPGGSDLEALKSIAPTFGTYVLSFVLLGIYWNNHHHLLHATKSVSGAVLWANLHLLFWLSLFPFATAWMSDNDFAELPTATYGLILLLAAIAYFILQKAIVATDGPNSGLLSALGRDMKGKISPVLYAVAIPVAFVDRWISLGLYIVVALMWLVPDRRLEPAHTSGSA
jgi:uncharacterized membrane protein